MTNLNTQLNQANATIQTQDVKSVEFTTKGILNTVKIKFEGSKTLTIQTIANHMQDIKVRIIVGQRTVAHSWVSDAKGYTALNALLKTAQRAKTQIVVDDYNVMGYMTEGLN